MTGEARLFSPYDDSNLDVETLDGGSDNVARISSAEQDEVGTPSRQYFLDEDDALLLIAILQSAVEENA